MVVVHDQLSAASHTVLSLLLSLQSCIRDSRTNAPTVSLIHLSSRQFEDKFPGFAAWREQHKGVPAAQTLDELASNKGSGGGSSRKRARQPGSSSSVQPGGVQSTKKKPGVGSKRRQQQEGVDDEDDSDPWISDPDEEGSDVLINADDDWNEGGLGRTETGRFEGLAGAVASRVCSIGVGVLGNMKLTSTVAVEVGAAVDRIGLCTAEQCTEQQQQGAVLGYDE